MDIEKAKTELDQAIEDLQELLDTRLDSFGGYPAEISTEIRGYIVIADLKASKEYAAPELNIIKTAPYMKLWRRAKRAMARGDYESLTEAMYECDEENIL